MSNQQLKGKWNQLKGQIKQKWGVLTDDDLKVAEGDMDELVGRIQQRTGESQEKVRRWLAEQS